MYLQTHCKSSSINSGADLKEQNYQISNDKNYKWHQTQAIKFHAHMVIE